MPVGASRGVRSLAVSAFHDCVLEQVCMRPTRLTLMLNGTRYRVASRKKIRGTHLLEFLGVTASTLGVQHVGKYWGYEEVEKRGTEHELRVLLDVSEELLIRFRNVRLQSMPASA